MALAITDTGGMSSNDCERGLLDTFLVKAFLPTSGLVWKIKMLKPFWGRIALYLDPSLADLRFARGWILLMTRVIIVCSDRFPNPLLLFPRFLQNSERKIHSHYVLPASAKYVGICKLFPMEDRPTNKLLHSAKAMAFPYCSCLINFSLKFLSLWIVGEKANGIYSSTLSMSPKQRLFLK